MAKKKHHPSRLETQYLEGFVDLPKEETALGAFKGWLATGKIPAGAVQVHARRSTKSGHTFLGWMLDAKSDDPAVRHPDGLPAVGGQLQDAVAALYTPWAVVRTHDGITYTLLYPRGK